MFLTKHQHFCLPGFGRVAHPSDSMFQHARPEGCGYRPEQGLQSCLALLQRTQLITQMQSITTGYVIAKQVQTWVAAMILQ